MTYNRTVATVFLVRPLGLCNKKESLNPKDHNAAICIKKHGFKEAFLADESGEKYSYPVIYCLFKPPNLQEFNDFIQSETEDGAMIVHEYDLPGGFVVLVYKFPELYERDYKLILEGKYSKTSDTFKSIFPVVKGANEITLYAIVLNKVAQGVKLLEDELGVKFDKNDELWYVPDMKKETLTSDKLQNYVK
jgi:hypothetical protein